MYGHSFKDGWPDWLEEMWDATPKGTNSSWYVDDDYDAFVRRTGPVDAFGGMDDEQIENLWSFFDGSNTKAAGLESVAVNRATNFDHDKFITDVNQSYLRGLESLGFKGSTNGLSYFQEYFDAYKNIYGANPYSPYIPNGTGFSAGVNVTTGFIGDFHLNIGLAFDQSHNYVLFGSYGGNFGYNGTLGVPSLGLGVSYDMYNNYGGNTDLFLGMKDYSTGYSGSIFFGGAYSRSSDGDFNVTDFGVETTSFNLGFGFNAGLTRNNTVIFYNSKQ